MSANSHFHSTHEAHYQCAVCSSIDANPNSLAVNYQCLADGSVVGEFHVLPRHQGYTDLLHGGIASSLLDGAMTHCLLFRNIQALTAQLDVRYHAPIELDERVTITAYCEGERRGIYQLVAQLLVNNEVRVTAKGKFIRPKEA
ncbi:TPA: PaaI family thioesterase [Vibrio diabolicus]